VPSCLTIRQSSRNLWQSPLEASPLIAFPNHF
jgi:hypothetical protein